MIRLFRVSIPVGVFALLLSEIILSQDTPAPIPKPDKPRHMLESSDLQVTEE